MSISSLELWRRKAALAPADTERKDDPTWAASFMACWHRPSRPSERQAVEDMLELLPPEIVAPSYWQVRRWNMKRSVLEREKGRRTGNALREIKGFRRRDTEGLLPMQIGTCD